MFGKLFTVCLLVLLIHCNIVKSIFTTSDFDFYVYLDEDDQFGFFWTLLNDTHIEIGIECENLGWCALGISPNGQMPDSDIMFFWIDDNDGTIYLQDRYASSRTIPTLDNNQDLILIDGSQTNSYTYIRFLRKIYPCDDDDSQFAIGTSRMLYAFNQNDPNNNNFDNTVEWHGYNNMGYKSVNVLTGSNIPLNIPDNTSTYDIIMNNYNVPGDSDTTYYCKLFELPVTTDKQHIIAIEPIITTGHEGLVHHMLLYYCPSNLVNISDIGFEEECNTYLTMSIDSSDCVYGTTVYGWAIGGEDFSLPDNVGLEMSGTLTYDGTEYQYALLEIHYDNPNYESTYYDSSGLRIYYTNKLRENSAGLIETGLSVYPTQFLPAKMTNAINYGYCMSECTNIGLPETGVKIISVFLHAHTAGIALKLRHIRNGIELSPIDENQNYDFNYQTSTILSDQVTWLPGDDLILECTYNTVNRTDNTYAGLSTSDEMCLAYLIVYPKPDLRGCLSKWQYNELYQGGSLYSWTVGAVLNGWADSNTLEYDASTNASKSWYNDLWTNDDYAERTQECSDANGDSLLTQDLLTRPTILQEYTQTDYCGDGTSDNGDGTSENDDGTSENDDDATDVEDSGARINSFSFGGCFCCLYLWLFWF